jgi:FkbM family methyltransferase
LSLRIKKYKITLNLIKVYNFDITRIVKLYKKSNLRDKSDLLLLKELKFRENLNILEFGGGDSASDSPSYIFEKHYRANVYLLEPILDSYIKLKVNRPGAKIYNIAVGIENKKVPFSIASVSTLSGFMQYFDPKLDFRRKIIRELYIDTMTFNEIIERYFHQIIFDLVVIDTEGSELEILQTIDFERFKPQIIFVEHNFTNKRSLIFDFLSGKNYVRLYANSCTENDLYRLKI